MSDDDEDDTDFRIRQRLGAPRQKRSGKTTTSLIARHLDQIVEAHRRMRGEGKTWSEIGHDLRPAAPIPGNTVSKLVRRLQTPARAKTKKKPTSSQRQPAAAAPEEAGAAPPKPTASPFSRKVDPLWRTDRENDE